MTAVLPAPNRTLATSNSAKLSSTPAATTATAPAAAVPSAAVRPTRRPPRVDSTVTGTTVAEAPTTSRASGRLASDSLPVMSSASSAPAAAPDWPSPPRTWAPASTRSVRRCSSGTSARVVIGTDGRRAAQPVS